MQCRVCGSQIPAGATACPVCGTPVQLENNSSQIPPTVYSPQPGQVPTNYGPDSYGTPPPPPSSSVDPTRYVPPSYDQPNYNQPVLPSNQPSYNQPNYNQPIQQGYGQPSSPNNYNNNQFNQYGNNVPLYAPAPGQQYGAPQGPKKRSPWLWIILGIVAVVVLACGGGTYALIRAGSSAAQTARNTIATAVQTTPTVSDSQTVPTSTQATPTASGSNTTNTGTSPSGNTVNSDAVKIIPSAQTASSVDKFAAPSPGAATASFKVSQTVYVTFKLNLDGIDINTQKLYVYALFYDGSIPVAKGDPLLINIRAPGGDFFYSYTSATQQGEAELYLCHQSDCSDKELAQVVSFTVSD